MDELIGLFGVSEEDGYEHNYEAQLLSSASFTNQASTSSQHNITTLNNTFNNTCTLCSSYSPLNNATHLMNKSTSSSQKNVSTSCPCNCDAKSGDLAPAGSSSRNNRRQRCDSSQEGKNNKSVLHVEAEVEEGNVEFKLKLINPSESRMEHLITQMKWRLREGHGEAIYQLGVEDSGALLGLCEAELEISLNNLHKMAQRLNADCTLLREVIVDEERQRKAVEVLVRKIPSDKPFIDMRVCVLGNVDCGKSSLVGVLTTRQLDSGRGRARLNLLRHPHEIETGHTSSVCHEILGFDSQGRAVDYSVVRNKEEICEASSKLITIIDLPGCQRSLKTTIFGLTGYYPDYSLVLVAANQGIVDTTRDHFALALALNIPCAMVITKCDLLGATALSKLEAQIKSVLQLPGVGKMCLFVREQHDAVQAASSVSINSNCVIPVFITSSVTGQGMDLLKVFLNVLPRKVDELDSDNGSFSSSDGTGRVSSFSSHELGSVLNPVQFQIEGFESEENEAPDNQEQLLEADSDFKIDETYIVPNVGCVVGGILRRGVIRKGDKMFLGPYDNGEFKNVFVCSLHRSGRVPCTIIRNNQTAAIAIKPEYPVRKGMVLLASFGDVSASAYLTRSSTQTFYAETAKSPEATFKSMSQTQLNSGGTKLFKASMELEAEVLILFHPTKVASGFQCTLHIDNIVQSAVIQSIVSTNQNELDNTYTVEEATSMHNNASPSSRTTGDSLSTNEKGHVTFRFLRHCEYVRPGMRLVLRHGKTKAIGHITKVFPFDPIPAVFDKI